MCLINTCRYWSRGSAPDSAFGGLEYNNARCLFDGNANHRNWFYTIGAYGRWGPGSGPTFPGPRRDDTTTDVAVDLVELYAFNYSAELGMSGDGSECPTQSYAKLGRACCRNEDGVDGPVRTLAAIDVRQRRRHYDPSFRDRFSTFPPFPSSPPPLFPFRHPAHAV